MDALLQEVMQADNLAMLFAAIAAVVLWRRLTKVEEERSDRELQATLDRAIDEIRSSPSRRGRSHEDYE